MARTTTATRLYLLTAREIQNAKDGDYSDGGGLTLRVSEATNSASWVWRFTAPSGRRREMGLGPVFRGSVKQAGDSLTSARGAAHEAREQIRRGLDPLTERDERKRKAHEADQARKAQANRERWTLARCARDYHARTIEKTRTTKHAAQWISSLENHMPAGVWHAPVVDINPPVLLKALEEASAHERARRAGDLNETMRRVRQRLDAVWEDAIFYGRATTNPALAIRRKLSESRPASTKGRLAALDYRQAPALLNRIRGASGTAVRCLEFAVLTASRTSEALLAEWAEVDVESRVWVVPEERMKMGEPHTVHLSERAVEILRGQLGKDTRLIFPSTHTNEGKAKPMSNMAMLSVLDRLGVRRQTTVHGLCRATFSTWANETAAARPDVIEAALAHSEADKVRRAYNRAAFDEERRALLVAWANFLEPQVAAIALAA